MKPTKRSLSRLSIVAVALLSLIRVGVVIYAQQAPTQKMGLIDDWTHHHLVFPNPGTAADALAQGRFEQWNRIVNDPRYQLQQLKRSMTQRAVAGAPDFAARTAIVNAAIGDQWRIRRRPPPREDSIKKDWSMGLEGKPSTITGTLTGNTGITTSPQTSVTIDGVTIKAAGTTGATQTGTFYMPPQTGAAPIVVTNGTYSLSISTSATPASATAGFLVAPLPASPGTITVGSGANTLTLQTNPTVASFPLTLDSGGETTTGSITYTYTGGASSVIITISPSTSTSCSYNSGTATATGYFAESSTANTAASHFDTALTDCLSDAGISSSFTVGTSSATVTLTDVFPGNFLSVTNGLNDTSGSITTGSNGYNFCSGESPTFTGTYATSNSTSTLLSNLVAVINSCPAAAGVSAAANGVVTDTILGTGSFGGTISSSDFTWTSTNGGGNGSAVTCGGTSPAYTAEYATSTSTTTLAGNVSSAISGCSTAIKTNLGISSVSSSTDTVTLTATSGAGGDSITVTPTSGYFAWAAGNLTGGDGTTATPSSTTTFGYSGLTTQQIAANIATAINNNTTLQAGTGVTATSGSGSPCTTGDYCVYVTARATGGTTLTGAESNFTDFTWAAGVAGTSGTSAVLPNAYPAKYSFATSSASCSDFAIYPTGTSGTNVPSIVAYTNLYTGCSGAVPTVSWAYATGGTVTTSPILSYWDDGAQVAFIQVSGSTASLVLIKWAAGGTLTSPVTPTNSSSGSAYRSCTPTASAPCMFTIALQGSPNDTFSMPFDDYLDDAIYVGDDSGKLHLFTGVFQGTPAEVYTNSGGCGATCPWPVTLTTGNKVSSPVYAVMYGTAYVYVGDFGGYFYTVTGGVSGGVATKTTNTLGDAFADAPLVDPTHDNVFGFVTTGNSNTDPGYNIVAQFGVCCPSAPTVASGYKALATGGTGYYFYAGAVDDMYYNSGNASYLAYGNLYVVSGTGTAGGGELYQISIQDNSLVGSTAEASVNTSEYPWPSPVTELCCNPNTGADLIFFSVNYPASGLTGCTSSSTHGCILAYDVSNPSSIKQAGSGLPVTTPGTKGCYATGGIIVDNASDLTGASQLYFVGLNGASPAATTTCTSGSAVTLATQASQASP